jgi:hypothetical protein
MLALSAVTGAGCGGDVTGAASGGSGGALPTSNASGGLGNGASAGQGGMAEGGRAIGGLSFGGSGTGGVGTGGTATGGTATGGTPTGGATATGGDACGAPSMADPPVAPVLFFALDAAGSMNETAPSTNGQSKWDVLRQVWPEMLAGLPASWAVGMMTWSCPDCPNGAYQPSVAVPIAALDAGQLALLADALPLDAPGGDRPTECAYAFALEQLRTWQAPAVYAESPRYIVFLTDGVPTVKSDCATLAGPITEAEYAGLIATAAGAPWSAGITTFVVGLPGSDQPQGAAYDPLYQLSLLAAAGGTALPNCTPSPGTVDGTTGTLSPRGTYCHYDTTTQPDLAAALKDTLNAVAGAAVTCRYVVPYPPPPYVLLSTTNIEVIATIENVPALLSRTPEDDCSQGGEWYFSAHDEVTGMPTEIELCPEACARVSVDPSATIDIVFACLAEI